MDTRKALLSRRVRGRADGREPGRRPAGRVRPERGPDAGDRGELGASETAFVVPSEDADRRLRYFTPRTGGRPLWPRDDCGPAYLFERAVIDDGTHTLETAAGTFDVELTIDGTVWMEQANAELGRVDVDEQEAADALGVDVASLRDVGADVPIGKVSTGMPFLMVPINFASNT